MGDVAETLDCRGGFGGVHAEVFHGFADGENHAKTSRFGATLRAAAAEGLASDGAGGVITNDG